ncbi:MAG: GMC family oxidoreductase [Spirochaetaceae bacterium]|nr:GMC family oxidoreductase [Myxococcales bacterium]MCB9723551.1 GMC family oxidoreductase [Spirochaetaceae bacterium]HPG26057.1 GMC family oxidoreductase [Myxococcota bacterium]
MSVAQDWLDSARERVRVFAQYDGPFEEQADVVVVGSGPCGAVAAYELAAAGKDVVLVEEGPPFTVRDFELDGNLSMTRTMREGGLRMTRGTRMPTMQAIALGGGSLVNSAICVRPPDSVFERWATRFDLERTDRASLDPHFDAISEFLGIAPTPDEVQGPRNLLFRDACRALGLSSEPIARNVRGCRGSGECFTGCRSRAKQSMDVSYVPAALRAGARVMTSLQVQEIRHSGRRATGVSGQVVAPFAHGAAAGAGRRGLSHRFRIDARAVVLAAGCTATPVLLERSGNLANASGQVGENLQFHPGVAIAGVFPEPTDPQFGATQGYQSLAFLDEGFKLETLWAPPPILSIRLPGQGAELVARFGEIPRMAVWDAIASANRSLGRVRARRGSLDPVLDWRLHPDDVTILRRALRVIAELFFAAGAEKILPGVAGLPEVMTDLAQTRRLESDEVRAEGLVMGGNHVFCTTRMHGDPTLGVVDEDGRCHDLDNLYIADTGIFPQCPSVNPMLTGMALARRQARVLADRL